jgi:hypothetical protein
MIRRITGARYIKDYSLWLKFEDGVEGTIDLQNELYGEMFEPLKDIKQFSQFSIHPELRTITWSNGADLSPEFLYQNLKKTNKAA